MNDQVQQGFPALLELSDRVYLDLFDRMTDPVFIVSGRHYAYTNGAYVRLLSIPDGEQLVGKRSSDFIVPEDRAMVITRSQGRQRGEEHPDFYEYGMLGRDGRRQVQVRSIPALYQGKSAVFVICRDITERKNLEEQLKLTLSLLAATLESTADGISTVDFQGNVLNFNQRFLDIWHLDESFPAIRARDQQKFTESMAQLVSDPPAYLAGIVRAYASPGETNYDTFEFRDGRAIERFTFPLNVGGKNIGVVWSFRDVTARKQLERLLQHNATHDPLTDLLNRRGFEDQFLRHLQDARQRKETGAFLLIDLDQFKDINDSLGHPSGDEVLAGLATALRKMLPPESTIGRLGGDEFGIVLPGASAGRAESIGQRMLAELSLNTFETRSGDRVRISASAGAALYPAHGSSVELLMSRADIALYDAKDRGRNRLSIYSPIDRAARKSERRLWLSKTIRDALDRNAFELHGQAIVDLNGGDVSGYELLLRLPLENGRVLRAGQFIDVAERSGMILAIDRWVVSRALQFLRETERVGHRYALAVNISGAAFEDSEFLGAIQESIRGFGVNASRLIFEITETAAVSNVSGAQRFISGLKALGCRFAIDDFGVGFSSMFQLKHLPVDFLKIDGSFVRHVRDNRVDQEVIRAMVSIAGALGMSTVAEAVRSQEDAELLREFGVAYGQGYYLGRPKPMDRLLVPGKSVA